MTEEWVTSAYIGFYDKNFYYKFKKIFNYNKFWAETKIVQFWHFDETYKFKMVKIL